MVNNTKATNALMSTVSTMVKGLEQLPSNIVQKNKTFISILSKVLKNEQQLNDLLKNIEHNNKVIKALEEFNRKTIQRINFINNTNQSLSKKISAINKVKDILISIIGNNIPKLTTLVSKPLISKPSVSKPSVSKPSVSSVSKLSVSKPFVYKPSVSSVSKPSVSSVSKPSVSKPSVSSVSKLSVSKPFVSKPTLSKLSVSKPFVSSVSKPTSSVLTKSKSSSGSSSKSVSTSVPIKKMIAKAKKVKVAEVANKMAKKPIVLKNGAKLSKEKTKQVYEVVLTSVQNLINQIGNMPEPVHPNYKRFVSRLVKFLENEKKILSLTNKVANNKKFLKLMEMESFNNESSTEMMDIIQDGILESFTQDTIDNMDLSEPTIETMSNDTTEDPIVGLLMYVLLSVMIYVSIKYYKK